MATSIAKQVIHIQLDGGLDHWDTLVHTDPTNSAKLRGFRSRIPYAPSASRDPADGLLHDITPSNIADYGGRTFAFAPELPLFASEFNAGDMAVITSVGGLDEFGTAAEFTAGTKQVFQGFAAHNQMQHYNASLRTTPGSPGWGGLAVEQLLGSAPLKGFTLEYSKTWADGVLQAAVPLNKNADDQAPFPSNPAMEATERDVFLSRASDVGYTKLVNEFFTLRKRFNDVRALFTTFMAQGPTDAAGAPYTVSSGYTSDVMGTTFESLERILATRSSIDSDLNIYGLSQGGYDTHKNQAENLPANLTQLNTNLTALIAALKAMGVYDNTLIVLSTDFSRTLSENTDGTDHGWGGTWFMFGGGINGGQIVGYLPEPDANDPYLYDYRLRVVPQIETSQVAGYVQSWMGLNDGQIAAINPKLAELGVSRLTF